MDMFVKFIQNPVAIQKLTDFNQNEEGKKLSKDFINGLDSWIGEEDQKLMEYDSYYKKADH